MIDVPSLGLEVSGGYGVAPAATVEVPSDEAGNGDSSLLSLDEVAESGRLRPSGAAS